MHAHWVDVLDRANDDAVIFFVAHHLHLVLFPAKYGLFDQHFVGRRGVDAAFDDVDELGLVVGDAAAGAAHREGRTDDGGQADVVERLERVAQRLDVMRTGRLETDLGHGIAEKFAVFRLVDGFRGRPDHLDVVLVERAHFLERQRAVQRGLAAHGRQQRVGTLFLDDLGDDLRRDRLDVGRIGQIRVGHNRRRIGVHQDDPVALFLQRLAGLSAGIIELAGLADDDRAGAYDQDRFDVSTFGHGLQNCTQKKGALFARPWPPGGR